MPHHRVRELRPPSRRPSSTAAANRRAHECPISIYGPGKLACTTSSSAAHRVIIAKPPYMADQSDHRISRSARPCPRHQSTHWLSLPQRRPADPPSFLDNLGAARKPDVPFAHSTGVRANALTAPLSEACAHIAWVWSARSSQIIVIRAACILAPARRQRRMAWP